ncbi:MAG: MFS transporter [Halobacteriales archaeon]
MARRSVVLRYYAYQVTNAAGFYLPISLLYLQDKGFDLFFIGLSGAVFNFAFLTVEIPAGYVGDRLGRRASLAISSGLRAVAMVAYAFVESAIAFVVLWVIWAAGQTFRSGTLTAWLYEFLSGTDDEAAYPRIEGRGRTARLVTSAVGALAGGVLYTIDIRLPFLTNAALAFAGLPLLATLPAVGVDLSEDELFTVREAVSMLRLQIDRPDIRWFVLYLALFWGIFQVSRNFTQPAVKAVGLPVASLGVLYAGFQLLSAGATSLSGWVESRIGLRRFFGLLIPIFGLAYGSIAALPLAVVPVVFLYRGSMNLIIPLRNTYLNNRLKNLGRATVLSGAQMVLTLGASVASLVGGVIANATDSVAVFVVVGVSLTGIAGILWVAVSPVRSFDEHAGRTGDDAVPAK